MVKIVMSKSINSIGIPMQLGNILDISIPHEYVDISY